MNVAPASGDVGESGRQLKYHDNADAGWESSSRLGLTYARHLRLTDATVCVILALNLLSVAVPRAMPLSPI